MSEAIELVKEAAASYRESDQLEEWELEMLAQIIKAEMDTINGDAGKVDISTRVAILLLGNYLSTHKLSLTT